MPRLRVGAGSRPGGRGTFLCFAKEKYPKERRPPVCDPFAVRRGKPAAGRLRGAPWNSLCAARAARTATASQFTKHGRFDAHATPQPPRRRRSQQGWGAKHPTAEQPHGPSLRSAAPAQRVALAPASWGRAQQRPVWMFCPPCPCGCAEERRVWRIRARVCLSGAQRRELSETPPHPSTAGCPVAKRRGRRQRGRLSFGYFSLAKQRKVPRLPGDSRPPPLTKACGSVSARNQTLQNQ